MANTAAPRIPPREARRRLQSDDDDFLLVCAYEDDSKFKKNPLEGAIPLSEFTKRLPELRKDRAIAFY